MQNYSSSHYYGCSTSQEIHLLENLKDDDKYKRLHTKMWTQYSFYQYTNKVVCVICCRLQCTEEPSTHSYHDPNKNNPILPSYFFQTLTLHYPSESPKWFPLFRFSKLTLYSLSFTICMLHATYLSSSFLRLCYPFNAQRLIDIAQRAL